MHTKCVRCVIYRYFWRAPFDFTLPRFFLGRYPLHLAVDASSFMEPVELDKTQYMRQWMALSDPQQQVQESFKVGRLLHVQPVLIYAIATAG